MGIQDSFACDLFSGIQGLVGVLLAAVVVGFVGMRMTNFGLGVLSRCPGFVQRVFLALDRVDWFQYTEEAEAKGQTPMGFEEWKRYRNGI